MIPGWFGDLARGALAGASLSLIGSKMLAAFAEWPLSDEASYLAMACGAAAGIFVMWRAPPEVPVAPPRKSASPKLRAAHRAYRDWQDIKLRQAVEPHAIRLGIDTGTLMAIYSEIQTEMTKVGAA